MLPGRCGSFCVGAEEADTYTAPISSVCGALTACWAPRQPLGRLLTESLESLRAVGAGSCDVGRVECLRGSWYCGTTEKQLL